MVTKYNILSVGSENKMKSKIILYCIVFKLALAPFTFDLMKKYEIREKLKDSTFPFLLHFKTCVFVQSIYLPLMSSMQVYFVLCLFSFEGHLSPTPQFYASSFFLCLLFSQSISHSWVLCKFIFSMFVHVWGTNISDLMVCYLTFSLSNFVAITSTADLIFTAHTLRSSSQV